ETPHNRQRHQPAWRVSPSTRRSTAEPRPRPLTHEPRQRRSTPRDRSPAQSAQEKNRVTRTPVRIVPRANGKSTKNLNDYSTFPTSRLAAERSAPTETPPPGTRPSSLRVSQQPTAKKGPQDKVPRPPLNSRRSARLTPSSWKR